MKKILACGIFLLLGGCAGIFSGPDCRLSEDEYVARITDARRVAVIHFANGKANLSARDLQTIKKVAEQANAENSAVVVYGHASHRTLTKDPIQRILINLDISNERAVNVARAVAASGVPINRISSIALFDSRPLVAEVTRADEAANRRAEIYLYRYK